MRKSTKVVIVAFVGSMFLAAGSSAFAQSDEHAGGKRGEHFKKKQEEMLRELNLTPEQQDQLMAQHKQQREAGKQLREQIQAKRRVLRDELEKDTTNVGRVTAITTDLKALTAKTIDHRVSGILATKEALTPEQFRALNKKMDEVRGKRKGRMKKLHESHGSKQVE